jgi:hypothetical protein
MTNPGNVDRNTALELIKQRIGPDKLGPGTYGVTTQPHNGHMDVWEVDVLRNPHGKLVVDPFPNKLHIR